MQYKAITRDSLLSYLDDYLRLDSATMFVQRRGLRVVRWSYRQLVEVARQTARALLVNGIRQGDRVILCGYNSPEWGAAFWGCLLAGAVVVPLDRESTSEFAGAVQRQTDAKLVIADSDFETFNLSRVTLFNLGDLRDLVSRYETGPITAQHISEGSLAQIIFTSGTTATPKGVALTHGNLLANLLPLEHEIAKYAKWKRLVHPVRFLNLVPLSHVFGQFMGMFVPQLLGSEVYFQNSLNPAEIVATTRRHRISVIVLVPRLLESLRHWLERVEGNKLRTQIQRTGGINFLRRWWRFRRVHRRFGWKFWAFISGGATLEEHSESFWRAVGFAVLQGYGMTETASLISVTHPFRDSRKSVGKIMPGYELKLEQSGEILVRGASISPGYWKAEGQIARTNGEWLHTGDVGTIDDLGNLYFKGRAKEVIVTAAGLNIYPEDLEAALNQQPEVRSSCIIKVPDKQAEEPLAVLILNDSRADVRAIIERTNRGLHEYQKIRRWHVWPGPTFPLTSTHKILKQEVAATIAQSEVVSPSVVESDNVVLHEAARITGEQPRSVGNASLKLTTDLKLDSLGRIELLSALEDKFQIDIDEAAFTEATTVGEVEQIIRGEVAQKATPYPYPSWSHQFPITWLRGLLFYTIILPVTIVMSRMRVEGRQNLNEIKDPVLFIGNHVTLGDHALVLAALPLRLRHRLAIAMEGERLRYWVRPPDGTGVFMRLRFLAQYVLVTTFFQVFPLPKKSGFRRSFAYAAECVDRGLSVLVFPEGERAPRGQMHMNKFMPGIGVLASQLDIPVVPVKLSGLYELKRRSQYFASKGMVSVRFGAPLRIDRSLPAGAIAKELQLVMESM